MRQVWPAIVLALGACRSARSPDLSADAAADASAVLDATIDGTIDGTPDGAIDGMPDAALPDAPVDGCPHRTAPPGMPDKHYAPNEILVGSVVIRSQVDLDTLAGYKVVAGDLTISGSFPVLSLPNLEVVEGELDAESTVIAELHAPLLETAGSLRVNQTPTYGRLDVIELPRLESLEYGMYLQVHDVDLRCFASGGVEIAGATNDPFVLPRFTTTGHAQFDALATTTLELPALVGGTVEINESPLVSLHVGSPDGLSDVDDAPLARLQIDTAGPMQYLTIRTAASQGPLIFDVAHVTDLGYLDLESVSGLDSIAGLASTPVHGVWLTNAPLLTDLTPLQLTPTLSDFALFGLGATTMRFPSVVTLGDGTSGSGELMIDDNLSLTTLDLPNLTTLGYHDAYIVGNPMLPNCQATAIAAHVTLKPGHTLDIEGNGSGSCP